MLDCSPRMFPTADSTCRAAVAMACRLTADSPAMGATSLSLVVIQDSERHCPLPANTVGDDHRFDPRACDRFVTYIRHLRSPCPSSPYGQRLEYGQFTPETGRT